MFLSLIGEAAASAAEQAPPSPPDGTAAGGGATQPPTAPPWGRLLEGDVAVDQAEEPEEKQGDAVPGKRKRAPVGTASERWAERCTMESIQADQRQGCTAACGCVWRLTLDQVMRNRQKRSDEKNAGRRQFIRGYLEGNPDPDSEFGFFLHTEDSTRQTLCATGFAVYHGFTLPFLYHHRKRFLAGDRADDPNLGGNRRAVSGAQAGDAFDEDSVQVMAFKGWFKDLRDDTECMPNSRLRQLDYIQHNELFAECKQDLLDAGTSPDAIGGQAQDPHFLLRSPAGLLAARRARALGDRARARALLHHSSLVAQNLWRAVWRRHFNDLVVREVKQVDSKDRKRAELRRLLRRTVTRDETMRSLIKELRTVYRSSLRCERSFYWEARIRPVHFPLHYLTYIQDGATQRCAL